MVNLNFNQIDFILQGYNLKRTMGLRCVTQCSDVIGNIIQKQNLKFEGYH
jgi:hypothetical protein